MCCIYRLNTAFIKENLKFIIDPDQGVQPFAILGGDNNVIEEEIKNLKDSLGEKSEEGESTKLYKELSELESSYNTAKTVYQSAEKTLSDQLKNKATGNPNGIKYKPERFGEVNYDIRKLKSDIKAVSKVTFTALTSEEAYQAEELIKEEAKGEIDEFANLEFRFKAFAEKTEELVTREIAKSDKIEQLVNDALLHNWVKDGVKYHKDKLTNCAFCNNDIKENRWAELEKHFDIESDKLEKEVISQVNEVKEEIEKFESLQLIAKEDFYSQYHVDFDSIKSSIDQNIIEYVNSLKGLIEQLETRKDNILIKQMYQSFKDYTSEIESTIEKVDELRIQSNEYTDKLSKEQANAKNNLRLKEIREFTDTIKYKDQVDKINSLKEKAEEEKLKVDNKKSEIEVILQKIDEKQKQLKDESKGAEKVNELLNDYFGHNFLTLVAIEYEDELTGNKKYRFEIQREGKKAFHLSEGENSLIAFCYFIAKLQDADTKDKKPIIWIDDPISSLDSNHIFFIYTLINTQIYGEDSSDENFEQLFISTHNLNFLKYLKRLPKANNDEKKREDKKLYRYLIIERHDETSTIKLMPNYLRVYVSEFNYLFEQIYKCSEIENVNDENFTTFYNFGNNARKFLELFLYYKYPDSTNQMDKMKKFFGTDDIPAVLVDRINNEYSHLNGILERGESVVEVPEMNKAAKLIIDTLKQDFDQFEALLKSIGETVPSSTTVAT